MKKIQRESIIWECTKTEYITFARDIQKRRWISMFKKIWITFYHLY